MLSKKLSTVTPSFTIGISTKVKELKQKGIEIVNLSIGEPDFFTPENVKDAAIEAIKANYTKYDNAAGLLELRKAISDKLKKDNLLEYDASQIVVSSGAKHSITNILIALLDPGDEVIIPSPYWVSYPEMVKLTGGVPVFAITKKENSFKLKPDELKKVITNKTKLIFINNPSNPTGAVYSKEELIEIVDMCVENNIYIISDEIYEKVIYDRKFVSVASLSEDAYNITITVNGLSKSSSMTGWRIGYIATTLQLAKSISSIQGHLVSHPCTIAQWAALEAVKNGDKATKEMVDIYRKRRDIIIELFKDIPEINIIEPEGAFYIFIDITNIREKVLFKDSLSLKVCDELLENYRVAFVPGIAFGDDNFIRMSYATSLGNIKKGISEFKKYISLL